MSARTLREAARYLLIAAVVEIVLSPLRLLRGRLLLAVAAGAAVLFRDPERPLDPDPDLVYSPADGRVTHVDEVEDPDVPGGRALRISTFLALYDVHVNRSPVSGEIVAATETDGGYAAAFLERSSENHRKRLTIDSGDRRLVLDQFAGMVARRISSWSWIGDRVAAGDRIALIHLGSRADVLVPTTAADALVAVGDRVRAGETPIARYRTGSAAA